MLNMIYKKDVVNRIAKKTGLKKQDIKSMFTALEEVIVETLKLGEDIQFKNLFTIRGETVKARNRYIVSRGDCIFQKEHKTVKITPSKNLVNVIKEI